MVSTEVDTLTQLTYKVDWNFEQKPNNPWVGYYSPMIPGEVPYVLKWCNLVFGPRTPYETDNNRWAYDAGYFRFRDREDVEWFLLRWS